MHFYGSPCICNKNTRPSVEHVLGVLKWSYIVAKDHFLWEQGCFLVLADPPPFCLVDEFFPVLLFWITPLNITVFSVSSWYHHLSQLSFHTKFLFLCYHLNRALPDQLNPSHEMHMSNKYPVSSSLSWSSWTSDFENCCCRYWNRSDVEVNTAVTSPNFLSRLHLGAGPQV